MSRVDADMPLAAGGIRFRPTRPDELEWLMGLEQGPDVRGFVTPWSEAWHLEVMTDDGWAHWVIGQGEGTEPVGFVLLAGMGTPAIELRRIVVTARGRGVGRAALRRLKEIAFGEWGVERLWLDVFDFNDRAHGLYASEGFQEVKRLSGATVGGPEGSQLIVMEIRGADSRRG